MPIEPPASRWDLSVDMLPDEHGFVGAGADDERGHSSRRIVRRFFRCRLRAEGRLGGGRRTPRCPRTRRSACQSFVAAIHAALRVPGRHAFDEVITGCAAPTRPHGWIDDRIQRAYRCLHELVGPTVSRPGATENSWAACTASALVGCSQPSQISSPHRRLEAAVVALATGQVDDHPRLIDVQWRTDHLARSASRDPGLGTSSSSTPCSRAPIRGCCNTPHTIRPLAEYDGAGADGVQMSDARPDLADAWVLLPASVCHRGDLPPGSPSSVPSPLVLRQRSR